MMKARSPAFATIFLLAALGCSKGEPLPEEPTTVGAIVAARESQTGRYRLYRVVSTEPIPPPLGPKLHLVAYDETTADFQEASRLARSAELTPVHENVIVLAGHFLEREHKVVGYRAADKGEQATK